MNKHKKRLSMDKRVSRTVTLLTMLAVFLIGAFSFVIYRGDSIEINAEAALNIATAFSKTLDADLLNMSMDKEEPDEYHDYVHAQLSKIKTGIPQIAYIYVITLYDDVLFKYFTEGIRAGDDLADIGSFNEVEPDPDAYGEEPLAVIRQGVTVATGIYDTGYGMLVSGFAPVFDDRGQPVAVVGVDFYVDDVLADSNLFAIYIAAAGLVLGLIFGLLIRTYIKRLLGYSLNRLTDGTRRLNEGDLSFQARSSETDDEIGQLYTNFSQVAQTFRTLITDMNHMSKQHAEGEYESKLDESKFMGAYLDVARGVNKMVFMYINNFQELLNVVQSYGNGNFDANVHKYPGKLAVSNAIVDDLRANFININNEIIKLATTASDGNLSARARAEQFQGGWSKMLLNLNELVEALVIPMQEASNVLRQMSDGDLSVKMTGLYKGDLSLFKDNVNKTIDELASYIEEIRTALEAISRNDLTVELSKHFLGDFAAIEDSIRSIISAQDGFFREIGQVAGRLRSNASQISESSVRMTEGTIEQQNTIERLTDSIGSIEDQTRDNAKNAGEADTISSTSMQNAATGNEEMTKMLTSMEAIKDASNNIANIIKVIDGIAFQTNLLALNAAVEAARAGEHGKGFAVVAEEVRSLAGRSTEAAKQTQTLIDDTLERVNDGVATAHSTSEALSKIIDNVSSVSALISKISSASVEQENSVRLIADGVNQFSQGVADRTKTADENAAASEELANQSASLDHLLGAVKLKK